MNKLRRENRKFEAETDELLQVKMTTHNNGIRKQDDLIDAAVGKK